MADQPATFGSLELDVMGILWDNGEPTTVGDVHTRLSKDRELAYTTVMTVLSNLYKKKAVDRAKQGKAYVYWAKQKRDQAAAGLFSSLLHKIYDNNPAAVLAGFLKTKETLSADEIQELKNELSKWEGEGD